MQSPHEYIQCDVPEGMTLAEWRGMQDVATPSFYRRIWTRLRKRPT